MATIKDFMPMEVLYIDSLTDEAILLKGWNEF